MPDNLSTLQRAGLRLLLATGAWPHPHFTYSPFKILEFRQLVETLGWTGQERVLDIGCGAGLQTFLLARRGGHVTGIDIDPRFIAQARWYARHVKVAGRVDFDSRHLQAIGFDEATFDRIFSICVLEHIPEHREILAESLRILKPGGEMVFSVDSLEAIADASLKSRHMRDHGVVQYYTSDGLRTLLESIGFEGVEIGTMFRSALARELFERGIRHGFNFGRLHASRLAGRLARAEAHAAPSAPGIFLTARARKPGPS